MQTIRFRRVTGVLLAPLALAMLAGCSGTVKLSGSAVPAGASPSPTQTSGSTPVPPSPSSSDDHGGGGSGSGSSGGHGCPAGGVKIPAGAGTAVTPDLDGDGRPDTIWLHDVGTTRTLGVRTASGAGFSTVFNSAAPQTAYAVANRVEGGVVVLLDTGRSVSLYAVTDCKLLPSLNKQGTQYVFDKGFTGFGTGVGCPYIGSDRHLVGYLAKANSGGGTGSYTVTRTAIDLGRHATQARNGATTVLGTALPASSPIVAMARTVSCGPAGNGAHEPQ